MRTFQPGDTVSVVSSATATEQTVDVTLGSNTDASSPDDGTALLGVGSLRGASEWQSMSRRLGRRVAASPTSFPLRVGVDQGIVKVLNPVNIVQPPPGQQRRPRDPPDHASSASPGRAARSATADGLVGVLYMLAALNVFVGVFNMFPLLPLDGGHAAIAIYERDPGGAGRTALLRRRRQADAVDDGRRSPCWLLLFMSGLYLDITKPIG